MNQHKISRELLDKASQISPELYGRFALYLAKLTRAFAVLGLPEPKTAREARLRLEEAASILSYDASQDEVVRALHTAARNFSDSDALRFCREAAVKFSNQADALQKTLETVAAHKAQSQKKPWWKFW